MEFIFDEQPIVADSSKVRSVTFKVYAMFIALLTLSILSIVVKVVLGTSDILLSESLPANVLEETKSSYYIPAIINLVVAVVASVLVGLIGNKLLKKEYKNNQLVEEILYYANIGMMIGLLAPYAMSGFQVAVSTIIAVYASTMVLGGRGNGIFNTVATAVVVMGVSFTIPTLVIDGSAVVTPLESLGNYTEAMGESLAFTIPDLLIGNVVGISLITSTGILVLVALVCLAVLKVIDLKITLSFLVGLGATALVAGIIAGFGVEYALGHLLVGYTLFAATFLLTDETTSPITREAKIIYGVFVGIMTVLLRDLASLSLDALIFAILLANIITPTLNRELIRSSKSNTIKTIAIMAVVIIVAGLVVGFTIDSRFGGAL